MPKVTIVIGSYRRTTNLGNYSSLTYESTVTVELEEGDKYDTCLKRANQIAKDEVVRDTLADLDDIREKRDAIFASIGGK